MAEDQLIAELVFFSEGLANKGFHAQNQVDQGIHSRFYHTNIRDISHGLI